MKKEEEEEEERERERERKEGKCICALSLLSVLSWRIITWSSVLQALLTDDCFREVAGSTSNSTMSLLKITKQLRDSDHPTRKKTNAGQVPHCFLWCMGQTSLIMEQVTQSAHVAPMMESDALWSHGAQTATQSHL
jgi:aminoglycoside N3'-acetyltransferase